MEWISVDTGVEGYANSILYANEKFYLVCNNPNSVAISEDLINWEKIPLDNNKISNTNEIAYGNGIFIITGDFSNDDKTYIYTSSDGKNWKDLIIDTGVNFSMHINSSKFINNRFIFMTSYYASNANTGITLFTIHQFYETKDGKTINRYDYQINSSEDLGIMDIAYGNDIYVQIGESGSIFTSSDLKHWNRQISGVKTRLVGITFGKGKFVITGADGVILTSTDGINWTKQVTPTTSYLIRSRYANGLFVACGYNGVILTSTNGIDWIEEDDPLINSVLYGLTYANNYFVVSGGKYSSTNTAIITYSKVTREVSYSDNDDALYVFNDKIELLGVIDEFISLRWRRKYYEAGEFELVVAPYAKNLELLKKGSIIIRKNYTEAAIIDTKEYDDDGHNIELSVSGRFLSYLLHRRIVKKRIVFSGDILEGEKEILNHITPLSDQFEIEPTIFDSDHVEFQCVYKNVYDHFVDLSKLSNTGFRIVPNVDQKVYRFENFKGNNRTKDQDKNERYCFSKENSNVDKTNSIDTDVNKCNFVLVGGTGEDDSRILKEVTNGKYTGFDLYEKFLDAKSESNKDISPSEYLNILEAKGKEVITIDEPTITFTAYSNDYKEKWDLGDIVDVDLHEAGYVGQFRITEVEETIENGERTIFPVFGPPLAEKIDINKN